MSPGRKTFYLFLIVVTTVFFTKGGIVSANIAESRIGTICKDKKNTEKRAGYIPGRIEAWFGQNISPQEIEKIKINIENEGLTIDPQASPYEDGIRALILWKKSFKRFKKNRFQEIHEINKFLSRIRKESYIRFIIAGGSFGGMLPPKYRNLASIKLLDSKGHSRISRIDRWRGFGIIFSGPSQKNEFLEKYGEATLFAEGIHTVVNPYEYMFGGDPPRKIRDFFTNNEKASITILYKADEVLKILRDIHEKTGASFYLEPHYILPHLFYSSNQNLSSKSSFYLQFPQTYSQEDIRSLLALYPQINSRKLIFEAPDRSAIFLVPPGEEDCWVGELERLPWIIDVYPEVELFMEENDT